MRAVIWRKRVSPRLYTSSSFCDAEFRARGGCHRDEAVHQAIGFVRFGDVSRLGEVREPLANAQSIGWTVIDVEVWLGRWAVRPTEYWTPERVIISVCTEGYQWTSYP